jgi:hypothetical protein
MVPWVITLLAHAVHRGPPAGGGNRHPISGSIKAVQAYLEGQRTMGMAVAELQEICTKKEFRCIWDPANFIRNNCEKF